MKEVNVTENAYEFYYFIKQVLFSLFFMYGVDLILYRKSIIMLLPVIIYSSCLVYLNWFLYDNHYYDIYLYKNYFYNDIIGGDIK